MLTVQNCRFSSANHYLYKVQWKLVGQKGCGILGIWGISNIFKECIARYPWDCLVSNCHMLSITPFSHRFLWDMVMAAMFCQKNFLQCQSVTRTLKEDYYYISEVLLNAKPHKKTPNLQKTLLGEICYWVFVAMPYWQAVCVISKGSMQSLSALCNSEDCRRDFSDCWTNLWYKQKMTCGKRYGI